MTEGLWIDHDGGECPVPPGTQVQVLFRTFPWEAGEPHDTTIFSDAAKVRWSHVGLAGDIVAYKVLS